MNIGGYCSWKSPGEESSYEFEGQRVVMRFNDPGFACEYFVDVESPLSAASLSTPPERRVCVTTEPAHFGGYTSRINPGVINDYYKGLILSWHWALSGFPQTRVFQPAAKWVGPDSGPKMFGMSGFFSAKLEPGFDGYALRHALLANDSRINIPGTVFNFKKSWRGSPHQYPVESKMAGMGWMFHLAIENCVEDNYFTEKLIDCLACKVVPLYFGDPNIGRIFDQSGMIILEPKRAIEQINSLTESDYSSRIGAIEANFEKSKKYWDMDKRIAAMIYLRSKK